MSNINVPVVLFIFRRTDTVKQILERISLVSPKKIYLISDGARNDVEKEQVEKCRKYVEENINWNCEVYKNYATENMGVLNRIGLGAKWVFQKEDRAIFLEDDNLPDITFFRYCEELLEKWKDDSRVLWICGTNYLEKYAPKNGSSYVFTKHMLPCGWASWSKKYLDNYDEKLSLLDNEYYKNRLKYEYSDKALYKQQLYSFERTKYLVEQDARKSSWDFQMALAIRLRNGYGISPKYNLIKNIGVDSISEHGGTTARNVMVRRFTQMSTYPMEFPLIHPLAVLSDIEFEKRTAKIIIFPLLMRIMFFISRLLKIILRISKYDRLKDGISKIKKR